MKNWEKNKPGAKNHQLITAHWEWKLLILQIYLKVIRVSANCPSLFVDETKMGKTSEKPEREREKFACKGDSDTGIVTPTSWLGPEVQRAEKITPNLRCPVTSCTNRRFGRPSSSQGPSTHWPDPMSKLRSLPTNLFEVAAHSKLQQDPFAEFPEQNRPYQLPK